MLRLTALLVVVALAGPSLVKVACEWTCARASQAAAADTGTDCHQHGQAGDSLSISAGPGCHDLSVAAVVAIPQPTFGTKGSVANQPAQLDPSSGVERTRGGASFARLTPPSPPPAHIPLRI